MNTDTLATRHLSEVELKSIEAGAAERMKEGQEPRIARRAAEREVLGHNEIIVEADVREAVVKYRWQRRKKQRAARAARRRSR